MNYALNHSCVLNTRGFNIMGVGALLPSNIWEVALNWGPKIYKAIII